MALGEQQVLLEQLPDATVVATSALDVVALNERAAALLPTVASASARPAAREWLPLDSITDVLSLLEAKKRGPLTFTVRGVAEGALEWVTGMFCVTELDGAPRIVLSLRPSRGPATPEDVDAAHYRRLREAAAVRELGLYEHNHVTEDVYGSGVVRAQYGIGPTTPLSVQVFARGTHPDDEDFFVSEVAKAHDPAGTGVFDVKHRILTPDGETRWMHTCARTRFTTDEEGNRHLAYTMGSVLDITEATESQLENQRLAAILNATPDLVAITDFEGRLTFLNPAGRALLGLGPNEVLAGRQAIDLFSPQVRDQFVQDSLPTAVDHGRWLGESQLQGVGGKTIPVSLVLLAHKRTRSMGAYLSLIAHDLTHQKHLEAQLLHSQRLDAVGRLAGGIAHDFNNLLSVILGFTTIALTSKELDATARGGLREVKRAAERAAELTRQLLSFSRKQVLRPKVIDVCEVVGGMIPMLQRLVGESVELSFLPGPCKTRIKADPSQLEQVIMNLVVNARDALEGGEGKGQITIETDVETVGEPSARDHWSVEPGTHVVISVSDTGAGMDEATRKQVFEPFFTTKPQGSGTGLGLSTVFGIVKQSGGEISVFSEPSRGTTFKLAFPANDLDTTPPSSTVSQPVRSGNGLVLVVEDEPQLRRMLVAVLEGAGYETIAPAGPVEGLAIAQRRMDDIALLLTDVIMPQMTGKELADALIAEGAAFPILFMSGYTGESIAKHGILEAGINFLPKPITPEQLLEAVQQILG